MLITTNTSINNIMNNKLFIKKFSPSHKLLKSNMTYLTNIKVIQNVTHTIEETLHANIK